MDKVIYSNCSFEVRKSLSGYQQMALFAHDQMLPDFEYCSSFIKVHIIMKQPLFWASIISDTTVIS